MPLSDLAVDRSKASGFKGYCKVCDQKRCRAYYRRKAATGADPGRARVRKGGS